MPRVTAIQTNFTAGELSPRLAGRVDIARYTNGAKRIENAYPLVHGGLLRSPGSRFVTPAKIANKKTRLIPYIFSRTQAYILEFGDLYMCVYKDGAQVVSSGVTPYEIVTTITEAMLFEVDYVQGADSMFLAHSSIPTQRLQRFDHNFWMMQNAPFITTPFDELGLRPTTIATLSAATVGAGRTFTAGAATFLNSDVGRVIVSGAGVATITGHTSATIVTATITSAFSSTSLASGLWAVLGSPQSVVTPSAVEPIGAPIALDSGKVGSLALAKAITKMDLSGTTVTATSVAHGYANDDLVVIAGCQPNQYNGTFKIKGVVADTFQYYIEVKAAPRGGTSLKDPTSYGTVTKQTLGAALNTWRAEDVGKYVKINRGLVLITSYVSPTLVNGTIQADLDADVAALPNSWSLESSVWNPTDGYPKTVSLFKQRLLAAGSPAYPQAVWGSRIGEYLNFELGLNDDDALSFTISSDQANPIVHLAQIRVMVALTFGGEFTLYGGVEKAITPTNIQIENHSVFGCNSVRPVRIGNELFFVQRADRKIRAMAYRFDNDAYSAPDISVLSEHITAPGIVDMAYQQEPESVLWCVRADGQMASLTIDRDQDVIGWARHITDGFYESVAVIPVTGGEELWAVVRRIINGAIVRYVERFDPTFYSHSCIQGTSAGGATVWTGLSHLEGKLVDILADGSVMPRQVVSGGQVTLTRKAFKVQIGLPYTTTVETLTPEIQTGTGSAQGNSMRVSETTVRFQDTTGCKINGSVVPFRNFTAGNLNSPAPLFTGDFRVENLGWERGTANLIIEHDQPLPFHLLAVIKKLQVND